LLSGPSASGSGAGGANTGAAIRAAAAAALAEGGSATAAAAREAAAAVLATLSDASSAAALTASVSASAPGGGSGDEESEGFIIVETSFKVVAFTRSPLRLALLSIFVDLSFLLPNAAVGRITRASVRRALVNKLEVSDIVAWFARHAHRQVLRRAVGVPDETGRLTGGNGVIVPDNVVKQMGLWADERSRLSGRNAALITEFKDAEEFADWAAFCKRADVLLLQDTATRSLVVSLEGLQVVRDEHARRAALANGVAAPAAAPNQ
jgi:transcription initiation factor TFIIH subunit 4